MACDVWKEKEYVVVDFDPVITIKTMSSRSFLRDIRKEYELTSLTDRNVEESILGNVCITEKKQIFTMSFVLPTQRKSYKRVGFVLQVSHGCQRQSFEHAYAYVEGNRIYNL